MFSFLRKIRGVLLGWRNNGSVQSFEETLLNPPSARLGNSNKGQIAVILIFVIAVGIVFYFLANNVGKMGQAKVATMRGATVGAAQLSSMMASYGEKLLQEQLGGKRKICKSTSLLGLILKLIITIIVWIFAPYLGVQITGLLLASFVALTIMITVSIVLQITVVQPAITKMWNKYMSSMLKPVDQFMEQGIQSALMQAVSDPIQIPDLYDFNGDGVYGPLTTPTDPATAPDYISRFSFYYTLRLKGATPYPPGDTAKLQAFLDDLRKFVYGDPAAGNPGLWNPIDCTGLVGSHPCCPADPVNDANYPAMCDPCCVPKISVAELPLCCVPVPTPPATEGWCGEPDPGNPAVPLAGGVCDPEDIRPSCCDLPLGNALKCGNPNTCVNRTPFAGYPWVYDMSLEDSLNGRKSIRQLFGKDDEHRDFNVNSGNPNWDLSIPGGVQLATGTGFVGKDTTGFYGAGDNQKGIFPMFHESEKYNVDLSTLSYAGEECHWCSVQWGACADSTRIPRLALAAGTTTANNPSWCLDSVNIGAGPPLKADGVTKIDVYVIPENCASGDGAQDGWKPGGDAYCHNSPAVFPYASSCAKNKVGGNLCDDGGGVWRDCMCDEYKLSVGNANLWPDDHLDEFIYGLPEFFNTVRPLLTMSAAVLYQNLEDWYEPIIADWIEPRCTDPSCPAAPCNCPASFTKEPREGVFWVWRRELQWFVGQINTWLNGTYVNNDVWCVPAANPPCARAAEIATFTSAGVRGNLDSILACLDWNANDRWPVLGPTGNPIVGNSQKFAACSNEAWCTANTALCAQLPRSLDPGYCAAWGVFQVPNPADMATFQSCFNSGPIPKLPLNYCDSAVACAAQCGALPVQNNLNTPPTPYPVMAFAAPTYKAVTDTLACPFDSTAPYGFPAVANDCTGTDVYSIACPGGAPDLTCINTCEVARLVCSSGCVSGDVPCLRGCNSAYLACIPGCFPGNATYTTCKASFDACAAACN